jgi:hypothetical protein
MGEILNSPEFNWAVPTKIIPLLRVQLKKPTDLEGFRKLEKAYNLQSGSY